MRLKRAGLTVGMSFEAPLTQELIGDALGLTAIHVNRTLRCLRQDKLVAMDGKKVTIVDFEALSLQSDFENSYLGENARALWTRRTVQKPLSEDCPSRPSRRSSPQGDNTVLGGGV